MWVTPKTDWKETDKFNFADYNRIKNNLAYLHDVSEKSYADYDIADMGNDKAVTDIPYSDEINAISSNLEVIAKNTCKCSVGDKIEYYDNGIFIRYNDLNRIESATLKLYTTITSTVNGRRQLATMLGSSRNYF